MARIEGDAEIRATTDLIYSILRGITSLIKASAERGHEMSARREPNDSDLMGINMEIRSAKAHQAQGSLRVLKGLNGLTVLAHLGSRNAIFHQHGGNSFGGEP